MTEFYGYNQSIPQPKPKRIQRQRTSGWRMPEGAVYVGRPTKWGNPFKVGEVSYRHLDETNRAITAEKAVALFRANFFYSGLDATELRGKDLACWCRLDQPCHADVLLELTNR